MGQLIRGDSQPDGVVQLATDSARVRVKRDLRRAAAFL